MGIEEFNDRLMYCNPYLNPFGWASHFWGDYSLNKYDSPFLKLYEENKKRNANNDDFKKLFPALDLTTKAATGTSGVGEHIVKASIGTSGVGKHFVKEPSNLLKAALGPIFGNFVKESDVKTDKIPENLTTEQRKDYIQAHGGGLNFSEKK